MHPTCTYYQVWLLLQNGVCEVRIIDSTGLLSALRVLLFVGEEIMVGCWDTSVRGTDETVGCLFVGDNVHYGCIESWWV